METDPAATKRKLKVARSKKGLKCKVKDCLNDVIDSTERPERTHRAHGEELMQTRVKLRRLQRKHASLLQQLDTTDRNLACLMMRFDYLLPQYHRTLNQLDVTDRNLGVALNRVHALENTVNQITARLALPLVPHLSDTTLQH